MPALLLVPVLFASFAMAARSTLGHRAVNPSTVAMTSDHLVNDLALNSAYTLLYAVYLSNQDEEGGVPYGNMPFNKVVKIVREEMGVNPSLFTNPTLPTQHFQQSSMPRNKPYNLVIILEESLGAEVLVSTAYLDEADRCDRVVLLPVPDNRVTPERGGVRLYHKQSCPDVDQRCGAL